MENSVSFHCHPREAKFCCREMVLSRLISCHPESCSEAAYRCNPGTAGWTDRLGECEPKPTSISACPSQSPSRAPACSPPSPPVSPRLCPGAVWEGSCEPSEAPQTRIWEGVGRGRGFPSNLRQAWLRESFSKFPAAPAQVASAGRADSGKRASLAAASAATAASSALWAFRSLARGKRAGLPAGRPSSWGESRS